MHADGVPNSHYSYGEWGTFQGVLGQGSDCQGVCEDGADTGCTLRIWVGTLHCCLKKMVMLPQSPPDHKGRATSSKFSRLVPAGHQSRGTNNHGQGSSELCPKAVHKLVLYDIPDTKCFLQKKVPEKRHLYGTLSWCLWKTTKCVHSILKITLSWSQTVF